MGTFIFFFTLNKHKMKIAVVSLLFAFIVLANATKLDSILESKQEASTRFRTQRGIRLDPDEWCLGKLKHPRCWKLFAKSVWSPYRWFGNNLVTRAEGRPFYWCTYWCKSGDWWKDWVGKAHEEKREKKEEFCEAVPADACNEPENGCKHCCEKIPKSLACLNKVKKACPGFYKKNCKMGNSKGHVDLERQVNQTMKKNAGDQE